MRPYSRLCRCSQTLLAIGSKNTGKTTAANTALEIFGMPPHFQIRDMTDAKAYRLTQAIVTGRAGRAYTFDIDLHWTGDWEAISPAGQAEQNQSTTGLW